MAVVSLDGHADKKSLRMFFRGDQKSAWLKNRRRKSRRQGWGFQPEARRLPIEVLEPCPWHPRRLPTSEEVIELAHSILFHGLAHPLLVMVQPENPERYWVLDGLRRLVAVQSKGLGWETVPCLVSSGMSRYQSLALMLAMDETVRPYNLLERGIAFRELRQELDLTQEELAQYVRVCQSEISRAENMASSLCQEIKDAYLADRERRLTDGHLRELARLRLLPEVQLRVFEEMQRQSWSVRQLRQEVNRLMNTSSTRTRDIKVCNRYFDLLIRPKTPTPISLENLKAQLLLVNKLFFDVWNLTMEEQAEWYERVAQLLRDEYRQLRRQLGQKPLRQHE